MKNREPVCFAICARGICIIAGLEDLNKESQALAGIIARNFEELGI